MLDLTKNEKIAIISLLVLLLAGMGVILYQRTRPCAEVTVGSFEFEDLEEIIQTKSGIDINQASVRDFERLEGIGESLAKRIVAYRQSIGRFSSVDELKNVKGIGPKLLARIKDRVSIR